MVPDSPAPCQSWSARAGNLLIRSSLICSFCSNQMSDCERFAQIAQDKWVAVSESLRSLRGNERSWAIHSGRSDKMSDVSESLILLTKNEQMSDSLNNFWLKKSKILFYLRFLKKNNFRQNEWIAHSLIFWQKRAICSEIKWANSQPCYFQISISPITLSKQD